MADSSSNVDSLVSSYYGAAPTQAATSTDANPDQAAKALTLSQFTGVPASAIFGDVDGFAANHKAGVASDLVGNNPQLSEYVNSHPLAAAVSNDDWGNLDNLSQGMTQTSSFLKTLRGIDPVPKIIGGALSGAVKGFGEGFGSEPIGSWLPQPTSDNPAMRLVHAADTTLYTLPEVAWRTLGGLINSAVGATKGGTQAGYTAFGGSQEGAESFSNAISGMVQYELNFGQGLPEASVAAGALIRAGEAMKAARPWIENGLDIPRGVHPMIDEAKANINKSGVDQLTNDLTNAQNSATKIRSPEMFHKFVQQHYGDSVIGIHGDAVAALYEGKEPTPDDGVLGWVPGIGDKLALARETGADVHIPIADWISNVDPQVANFLHDDIRTWSGGITAREVAEPIDPKGLVDAPLPQVRGTSGLEPMFAMGDRKLSLVKGVIPDAERWAPEGMPLDTYHMLDENGKKVGEIEIIPDEAEKTLHVQMVNGVGGMYSNSFGPGLIRDIKRQLKAIYPDYQAITGHRVSGAREEAGTNFTPLAHPKVALDLSDGFDVGGDFHGLRQILDDSWQQITPDLRASVTPEAVRSPYERAVISSVDKVLDKMIGNRAERVPSQAIYSDRIDSNPLGAFVQHRDQRPDLLYDVFSHDAVGVARHEGIHLLYREGLFTPEEWQTLTQAAEDEGWLDRYGINNRYGGLPHEAQIEESIAEGYREWAAAKDEGRTTTGPISAIFQKMQDLWEGLKAQIKEFLGYEPNWQDVFGKTERGEVGRRDGQPIVEGAYREQHMEPAFSLDEGANDRFDNIRANAMGLDINSYRKLQAKINARYDEDVAAAQRRAEKEQRKRQTDEWKNNKAAVRKEVAETIRQRPDIASDLLIGSGELHGEKLRQRFPLRADDLTPEQKASLPSHYYSNNGLPVEDTARLFGYQTGDEMIRRLADYNAQKEGRSPQEMLRKVIDDETNRQMQARYGDLDENVMDAAKDQALSETNLNLLAEEMYAAGLKAGIPTIDRDVARAWVKEQFSKQTIGTVSSDQMLARSAKYGRDAERALIAGDNVLAMQSLQRKFLSASLASEARKLEKEVAAFDKIAKRYAKVTPSIDGEYMNYIHQILGQIGKPVRRGFHDVMKDIAARESKTLEDFVNEKQDQLREIPVAPQLLDPQWSKDYQSLTTDEFRAIRDSVKALAANGRDELKLYRAGEAEDFSVLKGQFIASLQEFNKLHYDAKGKRWLGPIPPKLAEPLRSFVASHFTTETILNRWDKFDPHGPWNQYVMRDLIEGANKKAHWQKEFAAKLKETADDVDLSKSVPNTLFRDPLGGNLWNLNRGNLRAILLNSGNRSNLEKLSRGYNLTPPDVIAWLGQNATKEDWDWAQKIWDMFSEIKERSDTMYRSLTGGVAPGSVPIETVNTPFGQYRGGYYPVIYHPAFEGKSKKLMGGNVLEEDNFVRATTPAGYTQSRTNYVAPVSLEIDAMPNRINQMLHDIALRPAVINAAKVFYDKDVRDAIASHYGTQYRDGLIPYLKAVANQANYASKDQQWIGNLSNFLRQNLVMTLVGLNPGTVLKHGPTAAVLSMKEVGGINFANAVKSMFSINEETGENNWQFAMKNSEELQRRDRNWQETLYGAANNLVPGGNYTSLRQKILELSSKPVALSDMLSAVPTWLAKYKESIESGSSLGDAVYDADRAVRRAHGSTAITNQPSIVRNSNPWFTAVYTFFNTIIQRQAETVWKAGEAIGEAKQGNYDVAMKAVPGIAAAAFAYVIWPAITENVVSPEGGKNESWEHKVADGLAHSLSGSWIGVRDLVNGILMGKDPDVGLLSTAYKEVGDLARDFNKKNPASVQNAGRFLQAASSVAGLFTGMVPAQAGKSARFIYEQQHGLEHPKGPWGWMTGLRYGTLKHHSSTLQNYTEGKAW